MKMLQAYKGVLVHLYDFLPHFFGKGGSLYEQNSSEISLLRQDKKWSLFLWRIDKENGRVIISDSAHTYLAMILRKLLIYAVIWLLLLEI